jgi:hypothetical protein
MLTRVAGLAAGLLKSVRLWPKEINILDQSRAVLAAKMP